MAKSLVFILTCLIAISQWSGAHAQLADVPDRTKETVGALRQGNWQELEYGLNVMRVITQSGLVITAYRISPRQFSFEVVLQKQQKGSRAQVIGEQEGAVLAINGGFFAQTENGALYSIGYLRQDGNVLSKGWKDSGGLIHFTEGGPELLPTHGGIPQTAFDVLQTRPMIIEPGSKWAMGSNLGELKHRTLLCKLKNGEMVFVLITRSGMSLYEAGWILRPEKEGGFFGCDSAVALDGGRSTQVWYSGRPEYSYAGLAPVQNFIIVRQIED
ncbi:MAG: phosphodiester glycosidase family protein [Pseudomonadota bacterium]